MRVLLLADNHIGLRTSKISGDAFQSEEILLKRLVSVPKTVKKGTLKAHFVGDIRDTKNWRWITIPHVCLGVVADTSRTSSVSRYSFW